MKVGRNRIWIKITFLELGYITYYMQHPVMWTSYEYGPPPHSTRGRGGRLQRGAAGGPGEGEGHGGARLLRRGFSGLRRVVRRGGQTQDSELICQTIPNRIIILVIGNYVQLYFNFDYFLIRPFLPKGK